MILQNSKNSNSMALLLRQAAFYWVVFFLFLQKPFTHHQTHWIDILLLTAAHVCIDLMLWKTKQSNVWNGVYLNLLTLHRVELLRKYFCVLMKYWCIITDTAHSTRGLLLEVCLLNPMNEQKPTELNIDINKKTTENPQCIFFLQANCCLKIHSTHYNSFEWHQNYKFPYLGNYFK